MKRTLIALSVCAALGLGAAIASAADGAMLFKTCAGCHGADGAKSAMGFAKPVKGQKADELLKKLVGYQDGSYGGEKKAMMNSAVKKYTAEELKALADYMATL